MRYVSLDIETTGLDPTKHQVLEVGAVLDDLANPKPMEELPTFHCYVLNGDLVGDPYALSMHPTILRRIATRDPDYVYLNRGMVGRELFNWLYRHLSDLPGEAAVKINAAGKNFASFDRPFLKALPGFSSWVDLGHRCIDPGSMYLRHDDERIPDTKTCCERAGMSHYDGHTAVEDALQVVRLIRNYFEVPSDV